MATNTKRSSDKGKAANSGVTPASIQISAFFDDVEELLRRVTSLQDEEVARLRQRVESSLRDARDAVEKGMRRVADSTTVAAKTTNDYVRTNPWKAVSVAAVACLALGTILRPRP